MITQSIHIEKDIMAEIMQNRIKDAIDGTADKAKTGVDAATNGANGAKEEAPGLADRAKANAGDLMDLAGDVASHAKEKVQEWAGEGKEAIHHAGEKAQEWAAEARDAATSSISDFGKEVTNLVRKHPLPAVLVGFALGLLLGRSARMI